MNHSQNQHISFISSLSIIPSENKFYIYVSNFADDFATLPFDTETGRFYILTSDQDKNLLPIDPRIISLARMKSSEDLIAEISQLIQTQLQFWNANPQNFHPNTTNCGF